ncbi:MAG: hypothetical protein ABIF82_12060 [Planctomycetota bacterium]
MALFKLAGFGAFHAVAHTLVLRKELLRRLDALPRDPEHEPPEWADIVRDLEALVETELQVGAKRYIVRAEARTAAAKVFRACGMDSPAALATPGVTMVLVVGCVGGRLPPSLCLA